MKYIESLREGERINEIYLCKVKQSALTKAGKNGHTGCEDLGAWFCWNRRVRFTGLHSRNG